MSVQSITSQNTNKISMPRIFLHLEGLALLSASLVLYANRQFSWGTFALFLLAPDLPILLYPLNEKAGSVIYNLVHSIIFPLVLGIYSLQTANALGVQASLIWFAHIGMDHAFGYGFKYAGQFKETHFSRI